MSGVSEPAISTYPSAASPVVTVTSELAFPPLPASSTRDSPPGSGGQRGERHGEHLTLRGAHRHPDADVGVLERERPAPA